MPYKEVPTYENGNWTVTAFDTRDEFKEFVTELFKEPGHYEFDEVALLFNDEARKFNQTGVYCVHPFKSKDFISYWDGEKSKSRNGVIFKNGEKTWYLTRDYYFWINFLPIYDKESKKFDFPKVWDGQYHMALYELLAELNYKHCGILKKRQFGSEQPHSEPVLGEHGWYTMGEVKEGDKLWNPDGTLTTVLHKLQNGVKDVYTFEFLDGRKTRCGIDHNWEVYDRAANKWKVLTTAQLLETGLLSSPVWNNGKQYNNYRFAIRNTVPLDFKHNTDPEIDPYLLGIIIGDGSCSGNTASFTTNDLFIKEEIERIVGSDYTLIEEKINIDTTARRWVITYNKRFDFTHIEEFKYGVNPVIRQLKSIEIQGKNCYTKFIPESVQNASLKYRIGVVQGLMDSDGYVNAKGLDIHYTTCNFQLADDVAFLCRSLGIKVNVCTAEVKGVLYKRVRLSGDIPVEIFRLPRKVERFSKRKNKKSFSLVPLITIKKETYQEESSCIVVDNPNHLYITKDYIVTHNSYFHMAKLINQYWFEEGAILKMGASLKDYINEKGSWKFLNEYRDFLNKHTAWYRDNTPNKVLTWQQKIEETINGRVTARGLKSVITGASFEKDPTASVGGPVVFFFHEEAGIAPKMHITYEYIRPALQMGMITTGMFIAAGSVGDLDQCEPLKAMIMDPVANSIFPVQTNLLDENNTPGLSGLFIPEQWSMPPFIDKYGNSQVEQALEAIREERLQWKKDLTPEQYQLRISQKPTNIAEAFASRKVSVFPPHLLAAQLKRIEEKTYPTEYVELYRNEQGNIVSKPANKSPIKEFPISKKTEDKTGVICIYEKPIPNAPWGTYYASIDPVGEGKVTTSDSLCSIYVYKNATEIIKDEGNGKVTSYIEPETMVASWCGRFDDLQKTHERLEFLIEYYNAWTIVENNISLFIQYMISKKKQKYLVPKNMILFLKELGANNNVFQEYGWKNTGNLFKAHLLSYGIQSVQEEINVDTDPTGKILRTTYGVENIKDPMLLVEMQQYQDGLNVDRLVTYCALMAFMQVQRSNRGITKRVEVTNDTLENSKNLSNLYSKRSPFNNIGRPNLKSLLGPKKSPFRNLR